MTKFSTVTLLKMHNEIFLGKRFSPHFSSPTPVTYFILLSCGCISASLIQKFNRCSCAHQTATLTFSPSKSLHGAKVTTQVTQDIQY